MALRYKEFHLFLSGKKKLQLRAFLKDVFPSQSEDKVSVIVPIYNVEQFLPACLDSILKQTHENIEVVCVDDGSPDDSISVLRSYAAKDPRVRIVRKQNAGLGAARNTGVEQSTGEWLFFVDSDDTIPENAVESLLDSLKRSGSDFAVGSMVRDTATGLHQPNWARMLHSTERTGITISDCPEVLKNVFAWTKMFRRDFFHDVVGGFPDGIYEDQLPSLKAYLNGTFDVIPQVVCNWRIRDDGSSITQKKATLDDLVSRWDVIWTLIEPSTGAPPEILETQFVKIIGFDMRPYYEQVPRVDDEYWAYLHRSVREFVDRFGYGLLAGIEISDRLLAAATYHGYRDDVRELLRRRESKTWKVPGAARDGLARVTDEYFEDLQLKADGVVEVLNSPGDIDVSQFIETIRITDDELIIRGHAFLTNLSQNSENTSISIEAQLAPQEGAHDAGSAIIRPARISRFDTLEADLRAADPWNDHAATGFEAVFNLNDLSAGRWHLSVTVDVGGVAQTALLGIGEPDPGKRLEAFGPADHTGRWATASDGEEGGLTLERRSAASIAVDRAWFEHDTLCLQLASFSRHELEQSATGIRFFALNGPRRLEGTLSQGADEAIVSFDMPCTSIEHGVWKFLFEDGSGQRRVVWSAGKEQVETERTEVFLERPLLSDEVAIKTGPILAEVTGAALTDKGLQVLGRIERHTNLLREPVTGQLRSNAGPEKSAPLRIKGNSFSVTFPYADLEGTPLSHTRGFAFILKVKGEQALWPPVHGKLKASMPLLANNAGIHATFSPTPGAIALWSRFETGKEKEDKPRRAQHALQRSYRGMDKPRNAVLLETFNGKTVGCSPLALSRELHRQKPHLEQFWSVESSMISVPEWATPVVRRSPEWYELLASAKLLINNNNWPDFFSKRPYQTYVQAWHGTPLKRIGNDVPLGNLSLTYRDLMAREAEAWDFLIAQNRYSAEIFPRAFGFDGEVIEVGYPRNDSLVDETAELTRQLVRLALGIDETTRAILYAPTWRDNLKGQAGYGKVNFLNFEQLSRLCSGKIKLLYRGHTNTANNSTELPADVIDVTNHPDVNELMLASDALVTDYSSIFFDYAVMRKPIYFLVPDLDQYAGTTRGFYAPLEDIAPGPLCFDTQQLADSMNKGSFSVDHGTIDGFIREFAPFDDGKAASRVLASIFQKRQELAEM